MFILQVSQSFSQICKEFNLIYRHANKADPTHYIFTFSLTTSMSNLQKHLYTEHIKKWIDSCQKFNIRITTAAALEAIREYYKEPAVTPLESEHPQYSKEAFIDAIVDFVVGDDLVQFLSYFLNQTI
jgi:hypothetical protein